MDVRVAEQTALTAKENAPGAAADALKVFISYSRADMVAADRMVADLERNGFSVTIDRRDLPYGEEWQKELAAFIAASDTVVWLVSPASVKSKWVNWELGEVGRLSKRLVPVKVAETDPASLPEALGRIHLLPAEGVYESSLHEADLVRALNTDRAWLKKATSLSDDAREWMAASRDGAHLLRGRALAEAEAWSVRTPRDVPAPASEILELILASRRGQDRRRRMTVVGSIAAAIVAIGLAATAVWFGLEASHSAERAEANETRAENQAQIATANESVALAALSTQALGENRAVEALKLALAGWPRVGGENRPQLRRSLASFRSALANTPEAMIIQNADVGNLVGVKFISPDKVIATGYNGDIIAVDLDSGLETARVSNGKSITSMAVSPDGRLLAASDATGLIALWEVQTLTKLRSLRGHQAEVRKIAFSPDGATLLTGGRDGTARIWSTRTGEQLWLLDGNAQDVTTARFSHDGRFVITAARLLELNAVEEFLSSSPRPIENDQGATGARIWDTSTGTELWRIAGEDGVADAVFSLDGTRVTVVLGTGSVQVWSLDRRTMDRVLPAARASSVIASPTAEQVLVIPWQSERTSNEIQLFDILTGVLAGAIPHDAMVNGASFSQDGQLVVSGDWEGGVRVSSATNGALLRSFHRQTDQVSSLIIAPDNRRLLIDEGGGRVVSIVLDRSKFVLPPQDMKDVTWGPWIELSPQATTAALRTDNPGLDLYLLKLSDFSVVEGGPLDADVSGVSYSGDGSRLAGIVADQTVSIWSAGGERLASFGDLPLKPYGTRMSSNGEYVAIAMMGEDSATEKIEVRHSITGDVVGSLGGTIGEVCGFEWSPTAAILVAGFQNGAAIAYDAAAGIRIDLDEGTASHTIFSPFDSCEFAFSPDGETLARADPSGDIGLFRGDGFSEFLLIDVPDGSITSPVSGLRFSLDGSLFLGDTLGNVGVWETVGGQKLAEIARTEGYLDQVAFLGRESIVTVETFGGFNESKPTLVTRWDIRTGAPTDSFHVLDPKARGYALSAGGERLLTTSSDGTAALWDLNVLNSGPALQLACERLGKDISLKDVQERYGLGELTPICGDNPPLPVDWSTLQ
ncbi:MAG: toll/interleukin-1 receptor domain-containing protein [Rhizobiaceae bacterium]